MDTFRLDLITPQRQVFSEPVEAVYAPTPNGVIGILPHHVALFTLLSEGEIKIVTGKSEYYLSIGGGFMQVAAESVSILVSRAAHADEINEAEIKKASEAAKEAIKRKVTGDELKAAQVMLRRSLIDMKVLRRKQRRSTQLPS
jgi:F-type H+-transporting ATPase subunit epsilon